MSTRIGIIRTTAAAGLLGLAAGAGAAVYDDAADGPWDDPATWGVAGGCPVAGDAVVIDSGCTITVAGQAAFGSDTTRSRLSRGLVEIPAGASLLHVGKAGCEVTDSLPARGRAGIGLTPGRAKDSLRSCRRRAESAGWGLPRFAGGATGWPPSCCMSVARLAPPPVSSGCAPSNSR